MQPNKVARHHEVQRAPQRPGPHDRRIIEGGLHLGRGAATQRHGGDPAPVVLGLQADETPHHTLGRALARPDDTLGDEAEQGEISAAVSCRHVGQDPPRYA